jgi:nucleoside-diphosphate-sugar epimerase
MAWRGGREKSVAALCRKIAEAPDGGVIEVWGHGEQTRSYMQVDDAVEVGEGLEDAVPEPEREEDADDDALPCGCKRCEH